MLEKMPVLETNHLLKLLKNINSIKESLSAKKEVPIEKQVVIPMKKVKKTIPNDKLVSWFI